MDQQLRVEEARRRFAQSLVGRWSTVSHDGFSMVMDQIWEIYPDGTGQFTDTGPFRYPKSQMKFQWRQAEAFIFNLRLTESVAYHPDDAFELDEEDKVWTAIRYDFIAVPPDLAISIGLIDVAQAGRKYCGFYDSLAPLSYRGLIGEQALIDMPAQPS